MPFRLRAWVKVHGLRAQALPAGGLPAGWNEFPPVESTARQAYEHDYELLVVKDATTSTDAEGHNMSMKHMMPRLGRIVQSSDISLTRI
jgi:hypothetical protein